MSAQWWAAVVDRDRGMPDFGAKGAIVRVGDYLHGQWSCERALTPFSLQLLAACHPLPAPYLQRSDPPSRSPSIAPVSPASLLA